MLSVSTPAAGDDILTHLDCLINAMEIRTSAQTSELMALMKAGNDSHEAEEALWLSIDNLLSLRRQQMHVREILIDISLVGRR